MKPLLVFAAVVLSLARPVDAAPVVEVAFVDPARYTDAAPRSYLATDSERDATLAELRRHLQEAGARILNDGDRLALELLDVDLAGSYELSRRGGIHDRLLFDATVPRIHLRYTLIRNGVRTAGEERLTDLNYLRRSAIDCRGGGRLCYEKRMIDQWLDRLAGGR